MLGLYSISNFIAIISITKLLNDVKNNQDRNVLDEIISWETGKKEVLRWNLRRCDFIPDLMYCFCQGL